MTSAADPWAIAASTLPLAFSQVREDPRIDLEIARRLPPKAKVMMIASGGDTAVCLARLPLGRLVLVDMNPAQLALTRCKLHLAGSFTAEENMALLNHSDMPSETRWDEWLAIFRELGLPQDSLGPESIVADLGPDYCGRYEVAFTELRRLLLPQKHEISQFLRETHAATASSMIAAGTETGIALESAFASAFRLENLIALFGKGATRNPRRPFHEHFVKQLRDITVRKAPSENPWIWQLLAGKFPPATPVDWLSESTPISTKPEYLQSSMIEALANTRERSMDFIHLSNILDWLSPKEAHVTLAATHRALRPGGFVLIRQLNSSLDIPSLFPDLTWDLQEGRRLQLRDRSFFYPEILLASRP